MLVGVVETSTTQKRTGRHIQSGLPAVLGPSVCKGRRGIAALDGNLGHFDEVEERVVLVGAAQLNHTAISILKLLYQHFGTLDLFYYLCKMVRIVLIIQMLVSLVDHDTISKSLLYFSSFLEMVREARVQSAYLFAMCLVEGRIGSFDFISVHLFHLLRVHLRLFNISNHSLLGGVKVTDCLLSVVRASQQVRY